MLRVELAPNCAFNVTEVRHVKNPEQSRRLYAYSPYHHVIYGTNILAFNDDRPQTMDASAPYHSRKRRRA